MTQPILIVNKDKDGASSDASINSTAVSNATMNILPQESSSDSDVLASLPISDVNVKSTQTAISHHGYKERNVPPTLVPFTIIGEDKMVQAHIILSNLSDKNIKFKFKSSQENKISAHPNGHGIVPPHSAYRCILTWQLPDDYKVAEITPKRMLLVTSVMDEDMTGNPEQMKTTSTRLLAVFGTHDNEQSQSAAEKKQVFLLDIHGSVNMKEESHETAVVPKKSEYFETTKKDPTPVADMTEYLPAIAIGVTVFVLVLIAYCFNCLNRL